MTRSDGQLLVCERWGTPGAWQFPQGGVDSGESYEEALYREVREEIGLKPKHYKVVSSKEGYRYLYPKGVRAKKARKHGCHGQEQIYFLCELVEEAPEVDVDQDPPEFGNYRWIDPKDFKIEWVPEFKQEVYRQVMNDFFGVKL
jgi:putative (di)nucleoside polyphosphate hydrolase